MATQGLIEGQRPAAVDRSPDVGRGGSIGMVLLVAIALVGAAIGLLLVGRGNAGPYILALLAFLAMAGVFSMFALATGILRVAGKDTVHPMLKAVADEAVDEGRLAIVGMEYTLADGTVHLTESVGPV